MYNSFLFQINVSKLNYFAFFDCRYFVSAILSANRIISSLPQNKQQLAKTLSIKANWEELITGIELIMPSYPMYMQQTSNSIEINKTEAKVKRRSTDDESETNQHGETYRNKEYYSQKKRGREQLSSTIQTNIKCHNCSGFGHFARQCPSRPTNHRTNNNRSQFGTKNSQVNTLSLRGSELYRIQIQYEFT